MEASRGRDVQVASAEGHCFALVRQCLGTGDLHITTKTSAKSPNRAENPRSTDHGRARGKKTRLLVFSLL
jgi:hypothetical protein